MSSGTAGLSVRPPATVPVRPVPGPVSRILSLLLVVFVAALLVEVLFEGWVQALFAVPGVDRSGTEIAGAPQWPKLVKNGLYVLLAVLTVGKVLVDRRWREFRTRADVALAVLAVVLVLAGLVGGSSPKL